MKIQFEIKEKFPDIVDEIFSSSRWKVKVMEERDCLKRLVIIDPQFDSRAHIEIWKNEIHIKTAWSNYTYRVFMREKNVICEYIGAYRGFLEQVLLPTLTPMYNILEAIVLDTSIEGARKETLRQYGIANIRLRHKNRNGEKVSIFTMEHPSIVYDEFMREGTLIPSPFSMEK